MKPNKDFLLLYAVTDRRFLGKRSLCEVVEQLLRGGVSCLQLREKSLSQEEFVEQARQIKPICARYAVPLIINDSVPVALACDADGVHVGQKDTDVRKARELLGPDKIIGASAHNVEEALAAWQSGADYLGCGAVFGSTTKQDASVLDHAVLRQICRAVPIPAVAIGGITPDNISRLAQSGIAGVAVVSSLFAAAHPESAASELRRKALEVTA